MSESSEIGTNHIEIDNKEKLFFLKKPVEVSDEQKERLQPLFVDEDADEYTLTHWQSDLENTMEGTLRIIDRCREDNISTAFFLDKSARPLATIMRSTWSKLSPDVPLPQIRFIDIGRTQEEADNPDTHAPKRIADEDAKKLRERYSQVDPEKNILVIDEFSWSGNTIDQATMTLQQMYPQATVTGELALDKPPPWFKKPDLLDVTDPPKVTESYRPGNGQPDKSIARYFANPRTSGKEKRRNFRQQLEMIAGVIADNVEAVPKGSRRVSKVFYPRKPWD